VGEGVETQLYVQRSSKPALLETDVVLASSWLEPIVFSDLPVPFFSQANLLVDLGSFGTFLH
jgi:hypothetical protein